ncbi:hypothetical protein PR202_gb03847 [Eleusine coracana subsp. coracana]|uniref:Homeobox domain-containing protein n=1 Tax=Eleusine coracana subsp. coracana TaxID=191504 RepID=A0AAV5E1D9_ELECO|nr:hypothetical protein PR202_gb03847 [Eleusine coracana subsp. coracana]
MELVPFKPAAGALVEAGGGADAGSIPAMVAAQQEMLHAQVDQLQSLVVTQCHLTGVNPLAQEMAAGALSIKIGKKPRDLLNPKAVKCMQSLFALKDTIGKKETREISVLCGVTVTQVREFFASQRSQVRKFVNLSREKALRIEASKAHGNVGSIPTEETPLDIETRAEVVEPLRTLEPVKIPQSSSKPIDIPQFYMQPMLVAQSSLQPLYVLQNCLQQAEVQQNHAAPIMPSGTIVLQPTDAKINPDSVRKETKERMSFLALNQQIRSSWTINNVTILSWFLTMGGLTIVSTWLSQAAVEEQTSVILVIFKVILHLPLHKALPDHMSAVLQTINRLRFYRTQGVFNPHGFSILISEILGDESWKSEVDITEEILALTDGTNENRKPEPRKTPLLLTASADEPSKKSAPQTKSKQKRKVLLVEHPNKKAAGKNAHPVRSICTNNSRPLSADDIQKAKMRAMFMQEKYGKVDTSKTGEKPQAMETQKPSGLVNSTMPPVPRTPVTSTTKEPVDPSPPTSKESTVPQPDKPEISNGSKLNINFQNVIEKLDPKRVHWQIPPAVWIDPSWSVSAGESSKELEVQMQRNRREKETFYANQKDIPLDPKDPWDLEMDFDDSLTPEIPTEQQPDTDTMETVTVGAACPATVDPLEDKQIGSTSSTSIADASSMNDAEKPDFELLAVLLKNPQLVFALTSNEGENMPNEQTIALLDTLKHTGLELSDLVNNLANGAAGALKEPSQPESVPASLPSPTPPSNLTARAGWGQEHLTQARGQNLQHPQSLIQGSTPIGNAVEQSFSNVVSSLPSQSYASVSVLPAHIQMNIPSLPQLAASVNPPIQHVSPVNNHLNRASVHQHAQQYAMSSDPVAASLHQQPAVKKQTHGLENIPNPTVAHSSMPEPKASYTTFPWQSSVAHVNSTGRSTTPDPWAVHTTNSYNISSTNTVPYANQNVYGNHSAQNEHGAYGSGSTSSRFLPGHIVDRNGYSHSAEYQTLARDGHQRQSRSPELGATQDYCGAQGYKPQPRNAGQQGYNLEPSRQWSSAHQSYAPADTSRQQYSSGHQSYNLDPSRPWSSSQQDQNPETHSQWNPGKQDQYNPSDGRSTRRSYDHQHWRR